MVDDIQISVRVNPELYQKLKDMARVDNRSLHNHMINVLVKHVDGELTDKTYVKQIESFIAAALKIPEADAEKIKRLTKRPNDVKS